MLPFFFQRHLLLKGALLICLIVQVRNWIMPINRKYNLSLLLETLREEIRFKHKYKVLFEYVMLEGVNDRLELFLLKSFIVFERSLYCKLEKFMD